MKLGSGKTKILLKYKVQLRVANICVWINDIIVIHIFRLGDMVVYR